MEKKRNAAIIRFVKKQGKLAYWQWSDLCNKHFLDYNTYTQCAKKLGLIENAEAKA
ncbi:hypothetical protein AGMMS49944_03840 [Spirochaetia bacterium]|nr:hypothetical protein AGMMS49944_03840 [Spirochaetia bacterium]